jgi:hypothetical protein
VCVTAIFRLKRRVRAQKNETEWTELVLENCENGSLYRDTSAFSRYKMNLSRMKSRLHAKHI